MATIKSFTSLEQSRKLAEILPLESADMHYVLIDTNEDKYVVGLGKYIGILPYYPCWSLSALLGVLSEYTLKSSIFYGKVALWCQGISVECNNPVDACVAMIKKLHELKML